MWYALPSHPMMSCILFLPQFTTSLSPLEGGGSSETQERYVEVTVKFPLVPSSSMAYPYSRALTAKRPWTVFLTKMYDLAAIPDPAGTVSPLHCIIPLFSSHKTRVPE
jgi:hypothetical protein